MSFHKVVLCSFLFNIKIWQSSRWNKEKPKATSYFWVITSSFLLIKIFEWSMVSVKSSLAWTVWCGCMVSDFKVYPSAAVSQAEVLWGKLVESIPSIGLHREYFYILQFSTNITLGIVGGWSEGFFLLTHISWESSAGGPLHVPQGHWVWGRNASDGEGECFGHGKIQVPWCWQYFA